MAEVSFKMSFDRSTPIKLPDIIFKLEEEFLRKALEESKGVKQQAAQMLGMKRTTFVEKIKRHDFEVNKPCIE